MPRTARSNATDPEEQLRSFIERFDPKHRATIRALRKALRKRFPTATELVYDNYNFLVIGLEQASGHRTALFRSPPPQTVSASVLSMASLYPTRLESFRARANKCALSGFLPPTCLSSQSSKLFSMSQPSKHVWLFHVAAAARLSSGRYRPNSVHAVARKRRNHAIHVLNPGNVRSSS